MFYVKIASERKAKGFYEVLFISVNLLLKAVLLLKYYDFLIQINSGKCTHMSIMLQDSNLPQHQNLFQC